MKIDSKLSKLLLFKFAREKLALLNRSLHIINIICFLFLFGTANRPVYGVDPHCDNCGPMTGTFYECLHRTDTDPCDTTKCIENIIETDSCVLVAGEAPNNCNAEEVTPPTHAVRQIGRSMDPCNVNPGRETDFIIWKTVRYGCNTDCNAINYEVRCDATSCTGPVFEPDSYVGIKYKCGCTTPSIPTLSEWKQIFLTLLMLSLVMGFMRYRTASSGLSTGSSTIRSNGLTRLIFNGQLFYSVLK